MDLTDERPGTRADPEFHREKIKVISECSLGPLKWKLGASAAGDPASPGSLAVGLLLVALTACIPSGLLGFTAGEFDPASATVWPILVTIIFVIVFAAGLALIIVFNRRRPSLAAHVISKNIDHMKRNSNGRRNGSNGRRNGKSRSIRPSSRR